MMTGSNNKMRLKISRVTTAITAVVAVAASTPALPAGALLRSPAPLITAAWADGDDNSAKPAAEKADISALVPVELPEGAMRSKMEEAIDKFREFLGEFAKTKNRSVGDVELLVWKGAASPRKAVQASLAEAGYTYQQVETGKADGAELTQFTVTHKKTGKEVAGVWMEREGNTLLAWGKLTASGERRVASGEQPAVQSKIQSPKSKIADPTTQRPNDLQTQRPGDPITLDVDSRATTVNVMGRAMPKTPSFPSLAVKPGFVRGYAYDSNGRPLKGARIGVRSTATGGFYSGTSADTDEKGYYEVRPPFGVGHFYCAGYAVDYAEGRAALGLMAADGEAGQFASNVGAVENFVLAPYGIADRDGIQEDPRYCNNYFGGNFILSWYVDDGEKSLPAGSTIEVTLTPDGPMADGSAGRTIVIRKKVEAALLGQLYVNNIPAAVYKIRIRLAGGGDLHMKEVGPYANKMFGLSPKQAAGSAELQLRPSSAKLDYAGAGKGNWDQVCIQVER